MNNGFARFIAAKRELVQTPTQALAGARFAVREVIGNIAHLVQTNLPTSQGGGDVPQLSLEVNGGIVSTSSNGIGFYLPLNHSTFDDEYAEYLALIADDYELENEAERNAATEEELRADLISNLSKFNTLRNIVGLS